MPVEEFQPSPAPEAAKEKKERPAVKMMPATYKMAEELGRICAGLDIYLLNDNLVKVDYKGEFKNVTTHGFSTWICERVKIFKMKYQKVDGEDSFYEVETSLPLKDINEILEADGFLKHIRPITRFNDIRLPYIKKGEEDSTLEQMPEGYHAETQVYTRTRSLEYELDWPLERAKEWMTHHFGNFPFSDGRSYSVFITGLLSCFCTHLLDGYPLRPGFLYLANTVGSGKSLLAKIAIYGIFGRSQTTNMKEGDSFDVIIESNLLNGEPFIFLDNVKGKLKSPLIDQVLTTKTIGVRLFHTQRTVPVDNRTTLFLSGNNLDMDTDAKRRWLIIDLFESDDITEREMKVLMDDEYISTVSFRKELLSCLWAIVRNWRECGCPVGQTLLNSFETYSGLMGGVLTAGGFEDPMVRADEVHDAMTPEEGEFRELLACIAVDMRGEEEEWDLARIVQVARRNKLLESKIGTLEDGITLTVQRDKTSRGEANDMGYTDKSQRSKIGYFLRGKVGTRHRLGKRNEFLRFGSRSQGRSSTFTLHLEK